ncbi:hypothetical protein [Christiangramia salexigens]|uniref:3-oxoacyl-ACP synthase n=1 Tax=Christiangramia salexigens TaxID=1913577 RepID=A0A1L3J316_9FLAO|nr:hypothetical protein [Christiangramia salexigens]APG59506.1 hypothetical protein LPB144_03370 [Christiangramia salexigens]
MKFGITDWVFIRNSRALRNDELILSEDPELPLNSFLKSIYRSRNLNYSKFFKMDSLSKLGFLAMELLVEGSNIDPETALVFSNSSSSLQTDEEFEKSISEIPSPSLFVYTLPNIMLGELSIRHSLHSENIFFISEKFDPQLIIDYSTSLLTANISSDIVCGWVDLYNGEYDVFLCKISREGGLIFSPENLKKLYDNFHE